jgi:hypothetical protein
MAILALGLCALNPEGLLVKTNLNRWLPPITKTSTRRTALAAAGFAAVCGGIAGPAAAAHGGTTPAVTTADIKPAAGGSMPLGTFTTVSEHINAGKDTNAGKNTNASNSNSNSNSNSTNAGKNTKAGKNTNAGKNTSAGKGTNAGKGTHAHGPAPAPAPAAPAAKQLTYEYQGQVNFYYCGPAATRIAVSAHDHSPSQDEVASKLGTTINGTNSAVDTTRVLNSIDGTKSYHTTSIPGKFATPKQAERFQSDVVRAIGNGNPVVANIAGTATDTLGGLHSYDGGHYLTVVGYADNGRTVLIADPADTVADGSYWMHTSDVANWMATRGYSS